MGVVTSVITAATGLIGAVAGLINGLRRDSASGAIGPNPVIEELEERARQEQCRAETAERGRQRAEDERTRALEEQRRAQEDSARAAEAAQRAAQETTRAEDARRRAKEDVRQADEDRRRADENRRRADEERVKADGERRVAEEALRRAEAAARRMEEERKQADDAKSKAEADARRADNDKRMAQEEKRRAEEERRAADRAKMVAEEQLRNAEENRKWSEAMRMNAEKEARAARSEQDKAETAKVIADKVASNAQAALERAEKALKEGVRPIITPTREEIEATKTRLQYVEGMFHFAIAGVSGSGKSSLINAFRGLRNNEKTPLVARTGIVETTRKIARFADPNQANPFLWYDIPGAGTLSVPDWVYFNAQGLYIFDCIVILTDNRFTQTDEAILTNCTRFNIPAYIVRSKSKQHIQNVLEDMPFDEGEDDEDRLAKARDQYISETRESVARNLDRAQLPHQKVYMVDKDTLVQIIKGKQPKEFIDEWALINDLLSKARARRVKSRHQ